MVIILKYDDMLLSCAVSENVVNQVYVDGENGTLKMDNDNRITVKTANETKIYDLPKIPFYDWAKLLYEYQPTDIAEGIVECNRTVYNALVSGEIHENEASENLKVMEMVYAACDSAVNNEVIKLFQK